MLHILVTILKIVGILLLVILGILLFVLLSVLFVPFRYSVEGEKYKAEQQNDDSQVIKAKVVVSWLAHLVHFRFRIRNKGSEEVSSTNANQTSDKESKIKTDMELYLFGIPVFACKNKIATNSKKSKVKTNTADSEGNLDITDVSEVKEQSKDDIEADATEQPASTDDMASIDNKEVFAETETENLEEDLLEMDNTITEATGEADVNEKVNPIKKVFQTIQGIPGKIKAKVDQIKLTIKKICDKIKAGSGFLKDETTKATIRLLLGKLKNIIIHILPKKLKGNLIFGFDDPALTGEVLGIASLFYPKYQKTLKLIPVFEQQILEGKVKIKGRIVIAYIIWQAIKIVLDKNARLTFTNAKKLVAELKK